MAEPLRNSLANYLKTNSKPPTSNSPIFSSDPAVVYASNCALCHGSARQGGLAGPNITPPQIVNFGSEAVLSIFISSHMTGKDLTKDRRDLLAKYLKTTP
jgi:mono/diheme cytochrome c family protein